MNEILSNILLGLKPKPKLTISQWADEYRYIARGTSPEPGRWQTSRTPYAREIMDCFNTQVNTVVVMASSQVAKTEIGLNIAGYYIYEDPSPIMYLLPTDGLAEDFSKTRIQKTIDDTPVLKKLFNNNSRDSDNTISLKTFPGGYITIHGANTPTKLSSKPIRVLIADEVDRFPKMLTKEGDPLKLAIQRTTNFYNKKILIISTPTVTEVSTIVEWFEKTDKRYYYVACPDCDHEFIFNWEHVKWSKDDTNEVILDTVHIECPACFYKIKDNVKNEMVAKGRWVRTAPNKLMPGFHISSLYSPWVKLHDLVSEFVEVARTKDRDKLREFYNLKLGIPFDENDEEIDFNKLNEHRQFYDCELPLGVLYITCGVDVQDDRLAIHFIGWGENEEAWVLSYHEIQGDPSQNMLWNLLDEQLERSFSFADGKKITVGTTCIDSGGHFTDAVYSYVKPRESRRIFAIKGSNKNIDGIPIISNPTKTNRAKINLFHLGTGTAKETIYHRLNNINFSGPGYIHFPREEQRGCDEEYFKMLLSEKRTLIFEKGIKNFKWRKVYKRNEALDTFVYALAALRIANPDMEHYKKKIQNIIPIQIAQPVRKTGRRIISGGINSY